MLNVFFSDTQKMYTVLFLCLHRCLYIETSKREKLTWRSLSLITLPISLSLLPSLFLFLNLWPITIFYLSLFQMQPVSLYCFTLSFTLDSFVFIETHTRSFYNENWNKNNSTNNNHVVISLTSIPFKTLQIIRKKAEREINIKFTTKTRTADAVVKTTATWLFR